MGLLVLGTSGLFVTELLHRSGRAAAAAAFAARRVELLRPVACAPAHRVHGSESLRQGSVVVATNAWSFEQRGSATVRIRVTSSYVTRRSRSRTDTLETAVTCRG